MRRLSKVKIEWSPNFSYAIGLITTDGNLSTDGRHMNMTSKDEELVTTFRKCLGINNKVGRKSRGGSKDKKYFVVQFGDKNFYEFLVGLGLMPNKSKSLCDIKIPSLYFPDFLRGCIDGDGNIDVHNHPESQWPQLRVRLTSGSRNFLDWMRNEIKKQIRPAGGWVEKCRSVHILSYGKSDSIKLLQFIYKNKNSPCLKRKYIIASRFLRV